MDELVHALRIKGRASAADLSTVLGMPVDEVERALKELACDGFAVERTGGRRPGWLLSTEGRARASAQVETPELQSAREVLAESYRPFLARNGEVKTVCARWPDAADDEERFTLLDRLHEVLEEVGPALDAAARSAERFGRYRWRLDAALERAAADPRYVVSSSVDSFHQVWFECHEDLLLTLGRSRAEEGSW